MTMTKKTALFILSGAAALTSLLSGCSSASADYLPDSTLLTPNGGDPQSSDSSNSSDSLIFDGVCSVALGDEVSVSGGGAWYEDGVLYLTEGGVYNVSGVIGDGYIYIDTDENVKLLLNGVSVTNSKGAAIYCRSAKNLCVELAEGTDNVLTDGSSYSFEGENESAGEDEPNAAFYSKSDLIICGSGSLTVNGNYKGGIRCNDDLTVESGNITVNAVNNGIRGSDSVVIEDGNVTVTAGKDGIKSTNDTDEDKGYILISGGNVTVNAGEDGIQAERDLSVTGGTVTVTTTGEVASGGNDRDFGGWGHVWGGDTSSGNDDDATSKGIKSGGAMVISGGEITVSSTDHCVHSAGTLNINEGVLTLSSSAGKGISAHGDLQIDGGTIDVLSSTEGIESKALFTVNGGEISVTATDDGLNSGGGSDYFGFSSGTDEGGTHDMYINGGFIYINAAGDGIDSNGNITINGGTVLVNGPTSGGDGALDCGDRNNTITVNGGTLVAVGSLQMAENPSASSAQNSICAQVSLNAGDTLALLDESGNSIVVFTVEKQVQHVVISSPDIKTGGTYSLYTGAAVSGDSKGGLYDNGADVTAGESRVTVTVESAVTTFGNAGGFGGFGGGMGGFGGGHGGIRDDGNGTPDEMPDEAPDDFPGNGGFGNRPDFGYIPEDGDFGGFGGRPDGGDFSGRPGDGDFGGRMGSDFGGLGGGET